MRIPRPYRLAAFVVLAAALMMLGAYLAWSVPRVMSQQLQPPATVKVSSQFLRSEDLMFMVTNRIVTQVMVEQKQDSLLAGVREGILIATVKMYHGVDMASVSDEDIHDLPDRVVVVLPRPRLLDFAIDPNFKIIIKRSGVNVALDWFYGQNLESELRLQIQNSAMAFVRENELLPRDEVILRRLNVFAQTLSAKAGKPVVFSFEPPSPDEPSLPEVSNAP